MNGERNRTLLWILIGGGAFFLFVLAVFTLVYLTVSDETDSAGSFGFGGRIGVIEVSGVIMDAENTVRDLKKFNDDGSIKAIIVRINSPGGGAAASQEIYTQVKRIRDSKKKPIVASIETIGASGGYMVAVATDKIYTNPSAIVGSIGVIAQWVNYGELMRWAKLKDITLKAGELKDAGTPTRDLTPAEREYLQSIIDDMHVQFIAAVSDGRKMKFEEIQPLASGRVWTGAQAVPLKLVDQIADFQGVVEATAKQVGISGDPVLVRPSRERRSLLDVLFTDASDFLPSAGKLMESHPGFYYLWK